MSLLVQKFGGTSVGSPERIQAVADRIAMTYSQGHQVVVVVSAMGHTTDELIDLAHRVSKDPPHREMDMLLTTGERISMALLSMALSDRNVPAISLTGSQSGIITDSSHRRARIRRILGDRIKKALSAGSVVIVAGFQGVSETKEITTLGRGGSDTTAVALAGILNAEICDIFTDVDGVYSADPRIVPEAHLWRSLPYEVMIELATRGAGVLHPRSVELAYQFGVPLRVKNSLREISREVGDEYEGTIVKKTEDLTGNLTGNHHEYSMEDFRVAGITADSSKSAFKISLARPTLSSAICDIAARFHLFMLAPVFMGNEVWFFSDRDGESEWRKHLDQLQKEGLVKGYQILSEVVPLSVIGSRFSQDGSALGQVIEVLAKLGIDVSLGSASSLAITVGIARSRANDGIRALHDAWIGHMPQAQEAHGTGEAGENFALPIVEQSKAKEVRSNE